LRPAWVNSSHDSISKTTTAKQTGGVAQAVEHLPCKHEALSSTTVHTQKAIEEKLSSWFLFTCIELSLIT
jgi:hypothetical protein